MGSGEGTDWEFGIKRCKLLIGDGETIGPLYSMGNYIQYPVINCNGKENEKEYIHMHD